MEKRLIPSTEIHTYLLDILKAIDAFCTQNGIRYSMAYGTLIGAARHKGFIPWDDDIDLLMPRPDFERFISTFGKEEDARYRCIYRVNTPQEYYKHIFAKVHDSWTELKQDKYRFGLYVDIFPVDGKPDDVQFVSLYRDENGKIAMETGKELNDIEHNSIMEEFDELYNREQDLIYGTN